MIGHGGAAAGRMVNAVEARVEAVMMINRWALKRVLLAACVLTLASPWAVAEPGGRRSDNAHEANRQNSFQRQQQANNPREPQRFQRSDEAQRQRLSPEERRQLRRDVQDAGREIYPPRR